MPCAVGSFSYGVPGLLTTLAKDGHGPALVPLAGRLNLIAALAAEINDPVLVDECRAGDDPGSRRCDPGPGWSRVLAYPGGFPGLQRRLRGTEAQRNPETCRTQHGRA